jgi:hypothetical protein
MRKGFTAEKPRRGGESGSFLAKNAKDAKRTEVGKTERSGTATCHPSRRSSSFALPSEGASRCKWLISRIAEGKKLNHGWTRMDTDGVSAQMAQIPQKQTKGTKIRSENEEEDENKDETEPDSTQMVDFPLPEQLMVES